MKLVVDNSITAAWCIPDEQTPEKMAFLDTVTYEVPLLPAIRSAEFANALARARAEGRIDDDRLQRVFHPMTTLDDDLRRAATAAGVSLAL